MDLKEPRGKGVEWIDLAQDKNKWLCVVMKVMKNQIPWNAKNFILALNPGGKNFLKL